MTAAERLRAGKARLGLTTGQLARRWNVEPKELRRWLSGERPIPGTVDRLLALELERLSPRQARRAADMTDEVAQALGDVIAELESR
jgi:transcriptional regulator with XRE-family HTH domain